MQHRKGCIALTTLYIIEKQVFNFFTKFHFKFRLDTGKVYASGHSKGYVVIRKGYQLTSGT